MNIGQPPLKAILPGSSLSCFSLKSCAVGGWPADSWLPRAVGIQAAAVTICHVGGDLYVRRRWSPADGATGATRRQQVLQVITCRDPGRLQFITGSQRHRGHRGLLGRQPDTETDSCRRPACMYGTASSGRFFFWHSVYVILHSISDASVLMHIHSQHSR